MTSSTATTTPATTGTAMACTAMTSAATATSGGNQRNQRFRRAGAAVAVATVVSAVTPALAHAATKTKKAPPKPAPKTTVTRLQAPTSTRPPSRTVDPNRCSYAGDDAMSALLGVGVALDTSPGDAGSNTHAVSATFEQCVFNVAGSAPSDPGRLRAVLHVQRNATPVFDDFVQGNFESPCPADCVNVPGLGNRAVLSARYGDGGGFTTGAFVYLNVLKGSTRVFVALGPSDPNTNMGKDYAHTNEIAPAQVDLATKIAQAVLPQV